MSRPRGLLIALMMEAASTSETLVNFYHTTRRYNPEDSHLQLSFLFAHNIKRGTRHNGKQYGKKM
jgi:hypothetical protein